MSYLLLDRLEVRQANALASNYLINGLPIFAANMLAVNLALKLGKTASHVRGVVLIHHDGRLLGESRGDGFYDFHPQQRRGASFINHEDYSSKNKYALSMQPTATCHLTVSLLIEFRGGVNQSELENFLRTARFAGGQVVKYRQPQIAIELDDIRLPSTGYFVVERRDLLEDEANPLDALITTLGRKARKKASNVEATGSGTNDEETPEQQGEEETDAWLVPAVMGYAAITPFAQRNGVRASVLDDEVVMPDHAYVEPLIGLAQYIPLRGFKGETLPFWQAKWIREDVFVCQQIKGDLNHD